MGFFAYLKGETPWGMSITYFCRWIIDFLAHPSALLIVNIRGKILGEKDPAKQSLCTAQSVPLSTIT